MAEHWAFYLLYKIIDYIGIGDIWTLRSRTVKKVTQANLADLCGAIKYNFTDIKMY